MTLETMSHIEESHKEAAKSRTSVQMGELDTDQLFIRWDIISQFSRDYIKDRAVFLMSLS